MNNSSRIKLFILIAFLAAGGLLYYAYDSMQQNVKSLVNTIKKSAQPDRDLIRIKELWSGISGAGNNVRAFAMTRDETYLIQFLEIKDSLKAGIDSLKSNAISSGRPTDDLMKLESLLSSKVMVYDSLLDINYNRVINAAIDKMGKNEIKNDTSGILLEQGNLLQRMFSGKYSRKMLQAKTDSLLAERNNRVDEYNKNLAKIKEEEARLIQAQSEKELLLLESDKRITSRIENVITKLESEERDRIQWKVNQSEIAANEAANAIRITVISGLFLILILLILVMRDIAISNKRRKELIESQQKAEKLARAKEEFMSTMSHEIRTPLTSVIGFSEKLNQTELDPLQQRYMKAIVGSSEHLLSIVNDVLDFTRVDSGKLKFDE
nr:histidine kinase dimerization/phospho-acceptor domain-containing protein [Bacteroidia bacterium]